MDVGALEQESFDPSQGIPETLGTIRENITRLAEDVQHFSHRLHPVILEDLGLIEAIHYQCMAFAHREKIPVTFTPPRIPFTFPKEIAICLYRVTQEALHNIARHAKAESAAITLLHDAQTITLVIQDNERGLPTTEAPRNGNGKKGLGLTSMAERLRYVQGRSRLLPDQCTAQLLQQRFHSLEIPMARSRILPADDHELFVAGLRKLLEPEFEVVKTVGNGKALITEAQVLQPDLIILDVSMPLLNGIETIPEVRTILPRVKIMILSMHSERAYATQAMQAGASGYVVKQAAPSELLAAVRTILKGQTYFSPLTPEQQLEEALQPCTYLPPRQREVLQLMAEGNSTKKIAAILKLSPRTVESHRHRMMKPLNIKTSTQLIQYAITQNTASSMPHT